MKDFYYILGIDADCSATEITEAYKKLAKKFHPDLNGGDKYFEGRFREINEAYETLNDPARRFKYDSSLKKSLSKGNVYRGTEPINQSPNSADCKFKMIGSVFTIAVSVIVTVFGIYLIQSFNKSKKHIINVPAELSTTHLKIRKHLRPKQPLKIKSETKALKPHIDSAIITSTKPEPVIPKVKSDKTPDFLYATEVRANLTGIIYMRENDDFTSPIVEKIPDNAKVFVLKKGGVYYQVFYDGKVGYVPGWSLRIK